VALPHPRNNGRDVRAGKCESQRKLRKGHVGRDVGHERVHSIERRVQVVGREVRVAPVAVGSAGSAREVACQAAFVERQAREHGDAELTAHRNSSSSRFWSKML
jgi:hypothetical protein